MKKPTHIYNPKMGIEAFRRGDELYILVNGTVYTWDPESGTGWPGAVQHSGNFLLGNETRGPVPDMGDWVSGWYVPDGKNTNRNGEPLSSITRDCLCYGSNRYPSRTEIKRAFDDGGNGWLCRNPTCGHNDLWITWAPAEMITEV